VGKIGRVCVLKAARGTGLGAALMRAAVAQFRSLPGITKVKLGAQTHALGFYERLGFVAEGPEYMDAGIPHRDMILTLQ
jgi:ElaA protein